MTAPSFEFSFLSADPSWSRGVTIIWPGGHRLEFWVTEFQSGHPLESHTLQVDFQSPNSIIVFFDNLVRAISKSLQASTGPAIVVNSRFAVVVLGRGSLLRWPKRPASRSIDVFLPIEGSRNHFERLMGSISEEDLNRLKLCLSEWVQQLLDEEDDGLS